jgi:predicted nuclease of predicted toxin-antitoxin system
VKFLIDNQLPRMLVHLLVSQGHEACHLAGVGLGDANDETVWLRAARESAVIISKDEDFARRVYLGNCRNAHLRQAMQDSLPAIIVQLKAGDQLIEVY